jgi:hypothetical protein
MPQEVSGLDIQASDDIMDERNNPIAQHFEQMIKTSDEEHREDVMAKMQEARKATPSAPSQPWFMQPGGLGAPAGYTGFSAAPANSQADNKALTAEEEALLNRVHSQEERMEKAFGHPKKAAPQPIQPTMTQSPAPKPAILKPVEKGGAQPVKAVQAKQPKKDEPDDLPNEVVVSLR